MEDRVTTERANKDADWCDGQHDHGEGVGTRIRRHAADLMDDNSKRDALLDAADEIRSDAQAESNEEGGEDAES